MKRKIYGCGLIILSFVLAEWMDNWYKVGDIVSGFKGWLYSNEVGSLIYMAPLMIGLYLLITPSFVKEVLINNKI
jgi:hypothetical protein